MKKIFTEFVAIAQKLFLIKNKPQYNNITEFYRPINAANIKEGNYNTQNRKNRQKNLCL